MTESELNDLSAIERIAFGYFITQPARRLLDDEAEIRSVLNDAFDEIRGWLLGKETDAIAFYERIMPRLNTLRGQLTWGSLKRDGFLSCIKFVNCAVVYYHRYQARLAETPLPYLPGDLLEYDTEDLIFLMEMLAKGTLYPEEQKAFETAVFKQIATFHQENAPNGLSVFDESQLLKFPS